MTVAAPWLCTRLDPSRPFPDQSPDTPWPSRPRPFLSPTELKVISDIASYSRAIALDLCINFPFETSGWIFSSIPPNLINQEHDLR